MSRFMFIEAERANYAANSICRVVKVSRAAYYRWRTGREAKRITKDRELKAIIVAIHDEHRGRYGAPRICDELRDRGWRVSRKRVARCMRELNRISLRRKRFRTSKRVAHSIPDLIQRQFYADAPNIKWLADTTEIVTGEGKFYIACILDVFSRRIVGWSMSESNNTELTTNALIMAYELRNPEAGLIHHSDRGSPYIALGPELQSRKILQSVGQPATAYDNAMMESFFATLEKELFQLDGVYLTRAAARSAVCEYIETYYNRRRIHTKIGRQSPAQFEDRYYAQQPAA
jgi:putative transposase